MESKKNIEIVYDEEADILEIFLGEPTACYFNEIEDDIFEGREEGTNKLVGFKIFNLTKRKDNWQNIIKLPLPANIRIEAAD